MVWILVSYFVGVGIGFLAGRHWGRPDAGEDHTEFWYQQTQEAKAELLTAQGTLARQSKHIAKLEARLSRFVDLARGSNDATDSPS